MRAGLPSLVVKLLFISGSAASALIIAKPMMWVKETLPPRDRARLLLITVRLSMSNLAGTARTLVAVGTARELSMLVTTRAGAPRRGVVTSSLVAPAEGVAGMSRGVGALLPTVWEPESALAAGAAWLGVAVWVLAAGADAAAGRAAGAGA